LSMSILSVGAVGSLLVFRHRPTLDGIQMVGRAGAATR
jgi:hypothetical protein